MGQLGHQDLTLSIERNSQKESSKARQLGSSSIFAGDLPEKYILRSFQFALGFDSICVDKEHHIYTKVCQISPRNIFCNKTKDTIMVRQTESSEVAYVHPDEKIPVWWDDGSQNFKIQFKVDSSDCDWSQKLDFTNVGFMPV
jgi:hypothetical protein